MPKKTIIVQIQSASGFQHEMFKKSLKQITRLLVTVANILAYGDVLEKNRTKHT